MKPDFFFQAFFSQTISKEPHNENAVGIRRSCVYLQHFRCAVPCLWFAFMFWTVDLFRSDMLYLLTWFGHVPVKESFAFLI